MSSDIEGLKELEAALLGNIPGLLNALHCCATDCRAKARHVDADYFEEAALAITNLQADLDAAREALVIAAIPLEAIRMSGADAVHCQDVRDAITDGLTAIRTTLTNLEAQKEK